MRICFVVAALALAGCQKESPSHPGPDAAQASPDAAVDANVCPGALESCSGTCVNEMTDHDHCGSCDHACVPAASCMSSSCSCPAPFIGTAPPVLATQMIASQPGFVTGVAGVVGTDSNNHAVVVTASATAPLNSALPVNGQVFVAIAYELFTATQSKSTFLASAGTVRLTRRCAGGIAGSVQNLTLVEVNPTTLQPITGGCTTTISQLAFDIAQPCQ